jgi:fatty acid desaturase
LELGHARRASHGESSPVLALERKGGNQLRGGLFVAVARPGDAVLVEPADRNPARRADRADGRARARSIDQGLLPGGMTDRAVCLVRRRAQLLRSRDMAHGWVDSFTSDEIRDLRRISDLQGAFSLAVNWGLIAAAMAAVALAPAVLLPVVVPLAVFVIGARQLGMAVLMHEAAHRTLFRRRSWNDRCANWLAAYPVYLSLQLYRPYHLQHHARTGTDEDPDLSLARGWPVSRASMRRKILRDLSGITGVKRLIAQTRFLIATACGARRDRSEVLSFVGGGSAAEARAALVGVAIWQLMLLAICAAVGHSWLYLLWAAAWLTTYSLCMRIRSIAEHALTGDPADPLANTRTVVAGPWERLFVAPNRVNYHLEHHLLMTVPHHNLPRLHQLLHRRGLLEGACMADSYREVLARMVREPGAPAVDA